MGQGEVTMHESDRHPVLVVGHDTARLQPATEALRAGGLAVRSESRGATAAAALVPGGPHAQGLLVIDLTLPELDRHRLQQALGETDPAPESLEEVERRHIAAMLRHTGGNRRRAAQLLGLARSTLLAKIRRYQLEATSEHPIEAEV